MIKICCFLKGVLLWITALSILAFIIGGCESLIEQNYWLAALLWISINLALIYICKKTLSYRELYRLSGARYLEKKLQM